MCQDWKIPLLSMATTLSEKAATSKCTGILLTHHRIKNTEMTRKHFYVVKVGFQLFTLKYS
jgi:hypothetical protein